MNNVSKTDVTALENMVLYALRGKKKGLISDEIRSLYPGLAYSSITARYSELARAGRIVFTGDKRPGKSGRGQRVMVLPQFATTTEQPVEEVEVLEAEQDQTEGILVFD